MFAIILLYCHSTPVSTSLNHSSCAGCEAVTYSLGAVSQLACPVKPDALQPPSECSLQLCHGRVQRGQSQASLGGTHGQDERHTLERGKLQLDLRKIWEGPSPGTGFPKRLWFNTRQEMAWATSSSWPALSRGVGLDQLQRSNLNYSGMLCVRGHLPYLSEGSGS